MPDMTIGFNEFIAKAFEISAADQKRTDGVPGSVGMLDGRLVTVSENKGVGEASIEAARSKFLEAAVAELGEGHRAELQKAVYGDGKEPKPLSARTILNVEHMIHGSKSTMERLEGIMNRAAAINSEARIQAADVKKIFSVFKKVSGSKAFFSWQKKLIGLAKDAENKLNELLKVDPKSLATVFDKNPVEAVKQKFKAALDAQMELADGLKEFDRKTRGEVNGVDLLYTRASAKAVELFNLAAELSVMKASKRAGANLKDMFAKQALKTIGNLDVVSLAQEKIAPLLERVTKAKLNANNDGLVSCAETATLLSELESAKLAMADLAKNGIETQRQVGGKMVTETRKANPDFFTGAVKALDEAAADLKAVNDGSVKTALVAFAQKLYPGTGNEALEKVRTKAIAWAKSPGWFTSRALARACNAAYDKVDGAGARAFVKNLPDRLKSMRELLKEGKIPAGYKSDKMLALLLNGRLDLKTVALARAWGATDDMVDPEISDKNLLGVEELGEGQVNVVRLCRYKGLDGTEKKYVFKPELEADIGFKSLTAGAAGYRDVEVAAHINVAAKKAAMALGTPGAVTGVKVGCLNGEFGMFMEVAKGVSFEKMGNKARAFVSKMSPTQFFTYSVNYMRAASDLEWNDLLTGQSDRHWGNYLMAVDDELNVSVKGIDNDFAFPSWRVGMTRFRFSGDMIERLSNRLKHEKCRYKGGSTVADFEADFKHDQSFEFDPDGESFTIDVSKLKFDDESNFRRRTARQLAVAIRNAVGTHVMAKPASINKVVFDNLMRLNENRDEFVKTLDPHIGEAGIEAMLLRLDDMVAHAKYLEGKGRVMREEDWQKKDLVKSIVEEQIPEDMRKCSKDELMKHYYRLGIYQRDFQAFYTPDDESKQKGVKA